MELDMIAAIKDVGFPIFMVIYFIVSGTKRDENYAQAIRELRKTVENNTLTVQRLLDKLGKGEQQL